MEKSATALARLTAIAALIPPGSRVADVGADGALLPRALLASGRATFCLAIDSSPAAARAARAATRGLGPRLVVREGDGFGALEARDRIDVVVLAGLGARTILRILAHPRRAALGLHRLVLQPQTEPARVRRWLAENGFAVVDERRARERGRSYLVLAARPTDRSNGTSAAGQR